jgi:hypothetical protein
MGVENCVINICIFQIINRLLEPKCASDIHLSVDGRALEGRDLTLRDLNVQQDDILILRVSQK